MLLQVIFNQSTFLSGQNLLKDVEKSKNWCYLPSKFWYIALIGTPTAKLFEVQGVKRKVYTTSLRIFSITTNRMLLKEPGIKL